MASRSTQLLAQPSKEWVIPPKPKPGRKPKTEDTGQVILSKEGEQDRKVLNRAAQRAFRERKQSQLADLHARIQAYEQGEIERNVALQSIGKRLKEENDALRSENAELKEEVRQLKKKIACLQGRISPDGRATTVDSEAISPGGRPSYSKKRARPSSPDSQEDNRTSSRDTAASSETTAIPARQHVTSPSVSSRSSNTPAPTRSFGMDTSSSTSTLDDPMEVTTSFNHIDVGPCGFCSEATPCVCREASAEVGLGQSDSFQISPTYHVSPVAIQPPSILDVNVPYQPPVPLRLRTIRSEVPNLRDTWLVDKGAGTYQASSVSTSSLTMVNSQRPPPPPAVASCSGDPNNCPACADDDFGRAFCSALGDSMCTRNPCPSCPNNAAVIPAIDPADYCCGDPGFCGSLCSPDHPAHPQSAQMGMSHDPRRPPSPSTDRVPCDSAWRQLKEHPNIGFADLAMLADVVARRTKCCGPMEVVPAPSTPAPAPGDWAYGRTLVPQETLMEAGRKRRMEVEAAGVKEALAYLDRGFGRTSF